ncbi:MAG: hypothetical protein Q4C61_06580 [Lachnospiraceae bacterium]|nr:hypothetical protein [Lachnospiraceae bacterium]
MERFIHYVAIILVLVYIGWAIWVICRRRTVWGSIGASVLFLCGGAVVIQAAIAAATIICWAVPSVIAVTCFTGIFFD